MEMLAAQRHADRGQAPHDSSGPELPEAETANAEHGSVQTGDHASDRSSADADVQAAETAPRGDQIAQIREIILGGEIQAIESRFSALEATVEERAARLVQEMGDRLSENLVKLGQQVEELSQLVSTKTEEQDRALREADERLRAADELLQATRDGLGSEKEEREREVGALNGLVQEERERVDAALEAMNERKAKGDRQLMKELIDLRARLDQETSDIRRVTERGFATFANGTIARKDLAAQFVEMARRLADESGEASS
jgi:hypothetical protein